MKLIEKVKEYWLYIGIACGIFILGLFLLASNRPSVESSQEDFIETIETTASSEKVLENIYIDVKGAVNAPGLYQIAPESRLIEAIDLAGGFTA